MTAELKPPPVDADTKTYDRISYEKELCQHWAKRVVEALMQDEQLTAMLTTVIKQHLAEK